MDHPTREQWMEFLYDELPAQERDRLAGHLESCAECREAVGGWAAAKDRLDAWDVAAPERPRAAGRRVAVAALAAAALLVAGVAIGWLAAPRGPDVKALRAELEPALRESLAEELTAKWEASLMASQEALRQDVLSQVRQEISEAQAGTNALLVQYAQAFDGARRNDLVALARLTEQELMRTKWEVAVALANAPGSEPPSGGTPERPKNSHSTQ